MASKAHVPASPVGDRHRVTFWKGIESAKKRRYSESMNEVTYILSQIEQGDAGAAEQLLPLVYEELRKLAAAKLASEKPGQTLQATALVHEAYLRLVGVDQAQTWNSRGHFFGAAAEAMRRILVENARRRQRVRHGGGRKRVDLDLVAPSSKEPDRRTPGFERLVGSPCLRGTNRRRSREAALFRGSHHPPGSRGTGDIPANGKSALGVRQGVAVSRTCATKKIPEISEKRGTFPSATSHWSSTCRTQEIAMNDRKRKVRELFDQAFEIESEIERSRFLDQACHGDQELRAEVCALARRSRRSRQFPGRSPKRDSGDRGDERPRRRARNSNRSLQIAAEAGRRWFWCRLHGPANRADSPQSCA